MKKRLYITGFILILIALGVFSANSTIPPLAIAAYEDVHAGHDHGEENHAAHEKELESLFSEDEHTDDNHEAHDHARKPSAQHDGHNHGPIGGLCVEHDVNEAECALCQGSHLGDLQPGEGMKVRLASLEVAAKAGVRTARPQQVALPDGIEIPGRVAFDRERMAYMTSLAAGVVRKVHVQPGATVSKGDVLVEIAMPEVSGLKAEFATAQARLVQTEAAYQRERDLLARGISSRQEFQQAEAEYQTSRSATAQYRQQLLSFGLTEADLDRLTLSRETGAQVALRAPLAGVVTDLQTAIGEAVSAGTTLVAVADLNSLWVEVAIPESRIYQAEVGAAIQARFDGLPETVFTGRLFQVSASIDERTRALSALAKVQNPEHRLKVGMFGKVRILSREATEQLAVPADAVQSIDGLPYLFLQEEPDLFELRRVAIGADQDGLVVIATGLNINDQVVAGQGFALKSEVLKARLGASCADH